jgi:hypothetical protein
MRPLATFRNFLLYARPRKVQPDVGLLLADLRGDETLPTLGTVGELVAYLRGRHAEACFVDAAPDLWLAFVGWQKRFVRHPRRRPPERRPFRHAMH